MNIDEQIAVLQAYKEGKTVYCTNRNNGRSFVVNIKEHGIDYLFDFVVYDIGIKYEPREFWIAVDVRGNKAAFDSADAASVFLTQTRLIDRANTQIIHVREVTGE